MELVSLMGVWVCYKCACCLQSEVAGLHLRKEELKESLASVEHDLEVSRDKYR